MLQCHGKTYHIVVLSAATVVAKKKLSCRSEKGQWCTNSQKKGAGACCKALPHTPLPIIWDVLVGTILSRHNSSRR